MKLKFTLAFRVVKISSMQILVIDNENHEHTYLNNYPDAEIGDNGFIGTTVLGGSPIEFLSFAKEIKYCPMCSGLGYFPDNKQLCSLCKGQIVVKPEQYYGFYL